MGGRQRERTTNTNSRLLIQTGVSINWLVNAAGYRNVSVDKLTFVVTAPETDKMTMGTLLFNWPINHLLFYFPVH